MTSITRIGIALLAASSGALAPLLTACGRNPQETATIVGPSPTAPAVTPVGAMFVKGTVSDTAFRHLPGARIEVLNGPEAGHATTSAFDGQFTLSGAFDDSTQFRASIEGYDAAIRPLGPFCERCNPNRWVHFQLAVMAPPVNIGGTYDMTVTIDSHCTAFPNELATRTYTAVFPGAPGTNAAANAYFEVYPTGVGFVAGWNRFDGGVAGNDVGFWFESLVEQVTPNTFLMIGMSASGTVGASGSPVITAAGSGRIDYCVVSPDSGRFEDCLQGRLAAHTVCDGNHSLVFTQRSS